MMRLPTLVQRLLSARGGMLAILQTMIAQGLTMVVNVATGVITARLLGPSGRGAFAAATLWLLLPSLLATAGLQNAVIYGVRQRPEQASGIAAAGLIAATTWFVPLLLPCLWLLPTFMHAYPHDIVTLARTALLLSVANVWMVMVRQWLLATRRFGLFNMVMYGVALTYLGLLLALIPLHGITPASATYAQIGSTGLGLLAVAPTVVGSLGQAPMRQFKLHMRGLLRYGLQAAPIDIVTVLSQNVDRLILVVLISASEFGMYIVALSFARILWVLQTAISAVMLSDLADQPPAEIAAFTRGCFRVLFWAFVLSCGTVLLVDGRLLQLVYGSKYAAAVPVFRILLLDAALTCLAQILIQAFLAQNAAVVPSTIQLLSFAVSTAGVVVLAPILGSIGAASALAVGSLVRLVLLLSALRRIDIALPGILPRRADLDAVRRRLRRPNTAAP